MKKLTVKEFLTLMNDSKITHAYVAEENYCPITKRIMTEPVMAADGFTYEKEALLQWLLRNDRSPMTNQKLKNKDWTANHGRKSEISTLLDKQFIKPNDIYVNENTQDLENALHFQLLYPKVKRAFLKFAKVDVTIDWLRDFFIKKSDLFRYIADDNKQGVLTIFYGASKADVSKFFNQKYITEQDLNYILSGLNLCTVDHIKKIQDRKKYLLFLEKYGTVKDLLQLPPILIGALLNSAYIDKRNNDNLISKHKAVGKPKFIIEEKLQALGVPSLQKFNEIIQIKRHEYSFYKNIAIILEGKFGYPVKIIGQPIASQSTERVDLFKLANLNSKVVNCIVENPADLETLLLTDSVDFKRLVNADPKFLALILDDNSEEATTLLNTKKTNLEKLEKLAHEKLKIIFKEASQTATFLENGIDFAVFYKIKIQTLKLFLADDLRTPYIPVTSFLREIEIPITALNKVNPNHPALDWFLKNIHSLELTYKHENHSQFKEIIDNAVKRNASINELITLISQYDHWPKQYNVVPFKKEKNIYSHKMSISSINSKKHESENKGTKTVSIKEERCNHKQPNHNNINYPYLYSRNNTRDNSTSMGYPTLSSNQLNKKNTSFNGVTICTGIAYILGGLSGTGGETYHLLSQHKVFNSNKPLAISLLAAAVFFLLMGCLIQTLNKQTSNKHECCNLDTLAHIMLFSGIISVAGSAISLYFDANELNFIFFIAASVLMISSIIVKTIRHHPYTSSAHENLTNESTMVLE